MQELYLENITFKARFEPLNLRLWPKRPSDRLHGKRQSLAIHHKLCAPCGEGGFGWEAVVAVRKLSNSRGLFLDTGHANAIKVSVPI